jgi:RNase P subunit RPR2
MGNEVKRVHPLRCETCKVITPHAEDTVTDRESATVWHCLICGTERRPPEPGGSSPMARLPKRPPSDRGGMSKDIPREVSKEISKEEKKERVLV